MSLPFIVPRIITRRRIGRLSWNNTIGTNLVARYELPKDRGFYSGYATNESDTEIYLVDYYEDQFLHRVTLERP